MAAVYWKCFVCSVEIKKPYFLSVNESSFMFYEILGISNWSNDLQKIKFGKVCYCHECVNRIIKIRDMLEEFKKLEKEILQEKYKIKSELKESSTKYEKNFVIDEDGQLQQLPPRMLEIFREEIVAKFVNISTEPTLREVKIEEEAEEYKPCLSSDHFQILNYIPSVPTEKSLGQNLKNTTSEIEIKEYGIQEETFDISSLFKNYTKNFNTDESGDIQCRYDITDEDFKGSTTDELKQQMSQRSENENGTNSGVKRTRNNSKSIKGYWKVPKKCEECEKVLSTSYTWEVHKISAHGAEPKFKCNLCSYGSGSKSQFGRHMTTHSDEKNHKCDLCPNTFKDQVTLYHHIKTHEGKFQCRICLINFYKAETLQKHEILVH